MATKWLSKICRPPSQLYTLLTVPVSGTKPGDTPKVIRYLAGITSTRKETTLGKQPHYIKLAAPITLPVSPNLFRCKFQTLERSLNSHFKPEASCFKLTLHSLNQHLSAVWQTDNERVSFRLTSCEVFRANRRHSAAIKRSGVDVWRTALTPTSHTHTMKPRAGRSQPRLHKLHDSIPFLHPVRFSFLLSFPQSCLCSHETSAFWFSAVSTTDSLSWARTQLWPALNRFKIHCNTMLPSTA
jgi:hypothetical protein